MNADDYSWERYKVPYDQCDSISDAFIAEERARMAPVEFDMEYGCVFQGLAGGIFTQDMLSGIYTKDTEPAFQSFFTSAVKPYKG